MNENLKKELNDFIKETSCIYDLNDTLEWIMYNSNELLSILQKYENEMERI